MGLISNYINFVRESYDSYGDAIETQDLGVGGDYEALTGEPFGAHVVASGVIGIASGTLWVGPVTHLTYHAFERLYQGTVDYVFVNDVVNEGENTFNEAIDWLGQPVVPGVTRGDVVAGAASSAARTYIALHDLVHTTISSCIQ